MYKAVARFAAVNIVITLEYFIFKGSCFCEENKVEELKNKDLPDMCCTHT